MFVTFSLAKVLTLYHSNRLSESHINQFGEKYANNWEAFSNLLINLSQERVKAGLYPGRTSFSFIDRTKTVPSLVITHMDQDQFIPLDKPKSLDILDICLNRAEELLNTNKNINILWSGGLDSTLVLFSLLRTAKNIDQLSIVCTFESILESGGLFDNIIKKSGIRIKLDQTRFNSKFSFTYDDEDPSQLYITGHCADQLFGADFFMNSSEKVQTDPWYYGYDKKLLDLVEPSIKHSQRPIETIYDFRWWCAFNYTWLNALYDECVDRPRQLCQRIHSFYAIPEFQKWAIHTPSYYENRDKVKYPLKEALSKLVDYPYYVNNKGKTQSFTWVKSSNWYMMDKDFNNYYY